MKAQCLKKRKASGAEECSGRHSDSQFGESGKPAERTVVDDGEKTRNPRESSSILLDGVVRCLRPIRHHILLYSLVFLLD
jgi:hypothetical protein